MSTVLSVKTDTMKIFYEHICINKIQMVINTVKKKYRLYKKTLFRTGGHI